MTRAQYHCTFLWGRNFNAGMWLSGFQWLMCDEPSRSRDGDKPDSADVISRLEAIAAERPEILRLTDAAGGAPSRRYQAETDDAPPLEARRVGRIIRDIWSSNSFSAIKHGLSGDGNDVELVDDAEAGADAIPPLPADSPPAFTGPSSGSGTRFGNAFHGILEEALPGRIRDSDEGQELTRRMLFRYGVSAEPGFVEQTWQQALLVMQQPLAPMDDLRLGGLSDPAMVAEMEFDLSMRRWDSAALGDLLEEQGDGRYRQTARLLARQSRPLEGLLHGFIDLTFEWQGRYYVLDYKTNWLGNYLGNYGQADMDRAMQAHSYDLQYLIYSVAVHRWLGTLIPDYDYERHFGGAFYLFVRGMHAGGNEGIWYHRPQRSVIEGFDALMAPEADQRGAA
jgi:exodeoxyribonuclease V beta subunit